MIFEGGQIPQRTGMAHENLVMNNLHSDCGAHCISMTAYIDLQLRLL